MSRRQQGYRYPRPAAIDPLEHNRRIAMRKRFRWLATRQPAFWLGVLDAMLRMEAANRRAARAYLVFESAARRNDKTIAMNLLREAADG